MIVKYNGQNILTIGKIKLISGNNLGIDENEWKSITDNHPIIQNKIENGIIQVIPSVLDEKAIEENISEGATAPLSEFSVKEAVKIIKDCYNLSELKKWVETESRKRVKKAIEEQVESIENQ
jgi:hypothetical protein